MKKDYEVALSYAHKDEKIAEIFKKELKDIFANRFFMDVYKPEALASAEVFEEKLQSIFQRTNYSVILYSKNYCEGTFTNLEKNEILKRESKGKKSHLFIININDYELSEGFLENYTYVILKVKSLKNGNWIVNADVHVQIHDIIHNRVKKNMMEKSIQEKKRQKEYSLNIQTLFANGNEARWKIDYDWNLIGRAYIDEDGRKIKEETTWQEFWEYIKKDFLYIKENLKPDIMRRIRFNCHLSIAYKLGQIYGDLGQASGNRNLELISSNRVEDIVFTLEKKRNDRIKGDFNICQECEGNDCTCEDIVCIISIKPWKQENILETVRYYLEKHGQKYCKLYLFQEQNTIEDADTLESRAIYLREIMSSYIKENKKRIHLFPDTTAPLMFALGARTIVPGTIQLYEFIPEENSYVKSLIR